MLPDSQELAARTIRVRPSSNTCSGISAISTASATTGPIRKQWPQSTDLLKKLSEVTIPETLVSQYLTRSYPAVVTGALKASPRELCLAAIEIAPRAVPDRDDGLNVLDAFALSDGEELRPSRSGRPWLAPMRCGADEDALGLSGLVFSPYSTSFWMTAGLSLHLPMTSSAFLPTSSGA